MQYAYEQVESRNYETDISDENWELIKHLFEDKLKVFNTKYTDRHVVNVFLYLSKTGCPWRFLPKDLGNYKSLFKRIKYLREKGILEKILAELNKAIREKSGLSSKIEVRK